MVHRNKCPHVNNVTDTSGTSVLIQDPTANRCFILKSIQNVNVHDNTFKSKKKILYDNPNMCENNSMKNIQF